MDAAQDHTSAQSKPRSWRPWRFSLLTLMLLTAVICLGVSHFHTSRQLHQANQELRALRTEVGHLTIDDPTQAYVIQIPCNEMLTWKWRVYLPPGNWTRHIVHGEIPSAGTDLPWHASDGIPGGNEFTIEALVRKEADGIWELRVEEFGTGFSTTMTDEEGEHWLIARYLNPGLYDRNESVRRFDPDEGPVEIARVRIRPSFGKTTSGIGDNPQEPRPGFLIWFERMPSSKTK